MDFQMFMTAMQNLGAMSILGMMVWKSPAIIDRIQALVDANVKNVRETQKESLAVFQGEMDKVLTMVENRFEVVENTLKSGILVQTEMVNEVRKLGGRVEALEDAKPSK